MLLSRHYFCVRRERSPYFHGKVVRSRGFNLFRKQFVNHICRIHLAFNAELVPSVHKKGEGNVLESRFRGDSRSGKTVVEVALVARA